jgi:hypothetical protein
MMLGHSTRHRVVVCALVLGSALAGTIRPRSGAAQGLPDRLVFVPTTETYVDEARPGRSFAGTRVLRAGTTPARTIYLRFAVTGVDGRRIDEAHLRLRARSTSDSGGLVHPITDTGWDRTAVYRDRPPVDGPTVAAAGAVVPHDVVELDVSGVVTGDGTYSLAIDGALGRGVTYDSSFAPGNGGPVLVVTLRGTSDREATAFRSAVAPSALPANVGIRDFTYPANIDDVDNRLTAHKPESKLWYTPDGIWWASLFETAGGGGYRIHRLDVAAQTWTNTGVLIDERGASRQDALWDGTKLYIASHSGYEGLGTKQNRLLRFSYLPATHAWTLDAGFPVTIPGAGTESMTIARDTTGTLWLAFTLGNKAMVANSLGADTKWSNAYVVPVRVGTSVEADDIAGVIALPGKIGVFWSNQLTHDDYFALHSDGAAPTATTSWTQEIAGEGGKLADDHFNMKLAADGRLFVAMKTSFNVVGTTLIGLLVRSPAGVWSPVTRVATYDSNPVDATRPLCVLDETNRLVHVLYSRTSSSIHYKTSSMDKIAFPGGIGVPFIESSTSDSINNPTASKQTLDPDLGMVVVASDPSTEHYWHNTLSAVTTTTTPSAPPTTTSLPGPTLTLLPVADTTVEAEAASKILGADTLLTADGSPVHQTFLRFAVRGVGTRPVTRALLALTAAPSSAAASPSGGSLHRVASGTWSEATTRWSNRPTIAHPVLATAGHVTAGQVVEFDVSAAVTGDGTYDFALDTTSSDSVEYHSREAATGKPMLLLTLGP